MHKEKLALREFREIFLQTLPVMAGYLVLGFGFGILLKAKGYGVLWALAMSLFIYAGSMQYLMIDLITGGASLLTVAVTTLLVNARHLFYGISMVSKYHMQGRERVYDIFALTDETYSLVCRDEIPGITNLRSYYFFTSLLNQCYWVIGSLLGALAGSLLKINFEGIDFSLTALFVMVVCDQWLSGEDHVPALIGFGVSIAALLLFGSSNFLIPTMIGIAVLLLSRRELSQRRKGVAK